MRSSQTDGYFCVFRLYHRVVVVGGGVYTKSHPESASWLIKGDLAASSAYALLPGESLCIYSE
jgi:hypothetical protein